MINGWVILDKPLGITSTKAGARVKRIFGQNKLGHVGTLDPLASGVLPLALGEATKTIHYVEDSDKVYEFAVKWGEATSTGDMEGEVVESSEKIPQDDEIASILSSFLGQITQVPPKYSAIKINGKRSYELARNGTEFEVPSRVIEIKRLEYVKGEENSPGYFICECSKGTYIRTLAEDIAKKLGTFAHLIHLRRTRVGPFLEKMAISLDFLEKMVHKEEVISHCLGLDVALDDIPGYQLTQADEGAIRQGKVIDCPSHYGDSLVLCKNINGDVVAIARPTEGGLRPVRVFNL